MSPTSYLAAPPRDKLVQIAKTRLYAPSIGLSIGHLEVLAFANRWPQHEIVVRRSGEIWTRQTRRRRLWARVFPHCRPAILKARKRNLPIAPAFHWDLSLARAVTKYQITYIIRRLLRKKAL